MNRINCIGYRKFANGNKVNLIVLSQRGLKFAHEKSIIDEWEFPLSLLACTSNIGSGYFISAYSFATTNIIVTKGHLITAVNREREIRYFTQKEYDKMVKEGRAE